MSTVLERILETKKAEVAFRKKKFPIAGIKTSPLFKRDCVSLKKRLLTPGASGIIAEFKQKSPSGGNLNLSASVEEVTKGYVSAGATGLSVLTDSTWFGGSLENLHKARTTNTDVPILRKDFMVDPYQLYEAKAYGADVILLIAAFLPAEQVGEWAILAKELGMEVLFEIHEENELEKIPLIADIVGVNNRNLKTLEVSLETSLALNAVIPGEYLKISESGLKSPDDVKMLKAAGYNGFLIGESFMRTSDPVNACRSFINQL